MSAPVAWGAYSPDLLERVMAVLVAQDAPNVNRREPSSGDGGVDLWIPRDEGYEIWQVKGFTGRLTASRKAQVEKSLAALASDSRLDRPIVDYKLVAPIDLTSEEQRWLTPRLENLGFPACYRGETWWNAYSAKHPHVIDFYFFGGRERIRARSLSLNGLHIDPTQPLTAVEVAERLRSLVYQLQVDDPHYKYVLGAGASPGKLPHGTILAVESSALGLPTWHMCVLPSHQYSLADSPMYVTINVDELSEESRLQFEQFHTYGTAVRLPPGSVSGEVVAPGGLSRTLTNAEVKLLSEARSPDSIELEFVVRLEAWDAPRRLVVICGQAVVGEGGGVVLEFADSTNQLRGRIRIEPSDAPLRQVALTCEFSLRAEADSSATHQLLETLAGFEGGRLSLRVARQTLVHDQETPPLHGVPSEIRELVHARAAVADLLMTGVRVGSELEVVSPDILPASSIGQLLHGSPVDLATSSLELRVDPGRPDLEALVQAQDLRLREELVVSVDAVEHPLGFVVLQIENENLKVDPDAGRIWLAAGSLGRLTAKFERR